MNLQDQDILFSSGTDDEIQHYQKVLQDIPRNTCVIVAVPDHLHYEVTKFSLELGLHTMVVKPFTPTYEEGRKLVELADKKELHGAVEFHKRWDKSNLILREKFESGALGKPLYFLIEYSQRKSIPLVSFKSWAEKTSILQYLGVHYVDLVRFITEAKPVKVMATAQTKYLKASGVSAFDSIQCIVEWKDKSGENFIQILATNWIDPNNSTAMSDQKIKLIGTLGRYEADQKNRGILINTDEGGIEHLNPDFCMQFKDNSSNYVWQGYGIDSIQCFLDDVKDLSNGTKSINEVKLGKPTFSEALISTAVIEAAHASLADESKWKTIVF